MITEKGMWTLRKKHDKEQRIRNIIEPRDWDWNLPKRPYLRLPDEWLYMEAVSKEHLRDEFTNHTSPETVLKSAIHLIKLRIKITKNEIFRIGELLHNVVKPICRQLGQSYEKCIRKNFDFSPETAKNFVNVYEQCMGVRDLAIHLPNTVLYKISRPSFPEELRDWLLAQNNLEEITCEQVDGLFQKYRNGKFNFKVIEGDVKEVNRRYRIFRQVNNNLQICDKAIRSITLLNEKLIYQHELEDGYDSDEVEPEAIEINKKVAKVFFEVKELLEATFNESNTILDNCHKEIRKIINS